MMQSLSAHASTLAWLFAFLAVTGNTAAAFGAQGSTFEAIRLIVSMLFTFSLLIAIGQWFRSRRSASAGNG
jgi:ABC-type Na+ efflux pump permease subunit